jgi:hypothetical protein
MLAARTGWFPVGGMRSIDYEDLDWIGKTSTSRGTSRCPRSSSGSIRSPSRMRQMRGNLLDVLRLDYVTTARSKGLDERVVVFKHALRNALNPMITLFGYTLGRSCRVRSSPRSSSRGRARPHHARCDPDAGPVPGHGRVLMASVVLMLGNLVADLLLAARTRGSPMTESLASLHARPVAAAPTSAAGASAADAFGARRPSRRRGSSGASSQRARRDRGRRGARLFYVCARSRRSSRRTRRRDGPAGYFHPPQRCTGATTRAGSISRRSCTPRSSTIRAFHYAETARTRCRCARSSRRAVPLLGIIRSDRTCSASTPPGRVYLLGTDSFGRDVLSRLLYGSQISLTVGLVGIAISFTIGLLLGGISGYFGGAVDTVIMRATELLLSIPRST